MAAQIVRVGKSAHDAERKALAWLAYRLPESYTLYANSWIAQRSGVIYELDAVVVAPHGIFVVEIKSFHGKITGTDHDWFTPHPMRSPLRVNRLTAQIVASELQRETSYARGVWVAGYVFLSETMEVELAGEASRSRVHSKKSIIGALTDPSYLQERITGGRRPDAVDAHVADALHRLMTGVDKSHPPAKRVREYELMGLLGRSEEYVEYLAQHRLTQNRHVLRVYTIPWSASLAQRQEIAAKATWEARVLVNVGRHNNIVSADPPFIDEIGVCLPLEHFEGITLSSWVERYLGEDAAWPSLTARLRLWVRIAQALEFAHGQGVVHRLLRPDVILVENAAESPQVRLTGFDLAKQMQLQATVAWSKVEDERTIWAAPEILRDFHDAEPRSDQYALGMLLGLLCTGELLVPSTKTLLQRGNAVPHLSALDARLPKALDGVLQRMLAERPADRYESVAEAMAALRDTWAERKPARRGRPEPAEVTALDPEDLEPGTRLGSDYEVTTRLGIGGLATVYQVRNLAVGRSYALKIARPSEEAEAALRAEYETLSALDHPRLVKVAGLSKVVPERLTLVMERVEGQTLSSWLSEHPQPDPALLQRYAEDLFESLAYLESKGLTHKDIKPDNLLVGPDGLTVIDFSLVDHAAEQIFAGTALYRDQALERWDAAADRYAAALCLFELYVGVHAFDERVPEPGQAVELDADEVDPPGLAAFFGQALNPARDARFGTLDDMRQAFRRALGQRIVAPEPAVQPGLRPRPDADSPITESGLSRGTANALRRGRIATSGHLVAASPEQIRRIRMIGRRRLREALEYRDRLIALGVEPREAPTGAVEPPIRPDLADDTRPVELLGLSDALCNNLQTKGYRTVGDVASASASDLLSVPALGEVRLMSIRRSLARLAGDVEAGEVSVDDQRLETAWARATGDLTSRQREVLGMRYGRRAQTRRAVEVAEDESVTRAAVYIHLTNALERLDLSPLQPLAQALTEALDAAFGVLLVSEAMATVAETMDTEDELLAAYVARVLAVALDEQMRLDERIPGMEGEIITSRAIQNQHLIPLLTEAAVLAEWPPKPAEATRRSLAATIPVFAGDALALAVRLSDELALTDAGELFQPPADPARAIPLVLHRLQLPVTLEALKAEVDAHFAGQVAWPEDIALADLIAGLQLPDLQVEGDRLLAQAPAGVEARQGKSADALPEYMRAAERRPEEIAREMLLAAERAGSWRMVVTPPAQHPELGRNVARALGPTARFHSFEEALLARMEDRFEAFEKAERFAFLRDELTEAAEALVEDLLREHGRPGAINVLGDLALLELCQATHLVQRVYNATLRADRGLWVMVVPGVIHKKQPMLNRSEPLFHIEGAVLPLNLPMPLGDAA